MVAQCGFVNQGCDRINELLFKSQLLLDITTNQHKHNSAPTHQISHYFTNFKRNWIQWKRIISMQCQKANK